MASEPFHLAIGYPDGQRCCHVVDRRDFVLLGHHAGLPLWWTDETLLWGAEFEIHLRDGQYLFLHDDLRDTLLVVCSSLDVVGEGSMADWGAP